VRRLYQQGVAADESKVYIAVSDVRLDVVAPSVPGAQISPVNPSIALLLDNKVGGGLHALDLETGDEIWQTPHPGCNDVPGCSPAQSAAVTAIPSIVFSGGLDGHLRAYSAEDGRIVWDVDTKTEYRTVNGVAARGGSIDGPRHRSDSCIGSSSRTWNTPPPVSTLYPAHHRATNALGHVVRC